MHLSENFSSFLARELVGVFSLFCLGPYPVSPLLTIGLPLKRKKKKKDTVLIEVLFRLWKGGCALSSHFTPHYTFSPGSFSRLT